MRQAWLIVLLLAGCSPAPAPAPAPEVAPVPEAAPEEDAAVAAGLVAPTPAEVSGPLPARLTGRITYPSEELPVMRVCAVDSTDPGTAVCFRTVAGQATYLLDVPAGAWWLLAWPQDTGTEGDPGLLSAASACLASGATGCDDHALQLVQVQAGDVRDGLDINDWYYDRGEFPPPMPPRDPDDGSQ
ncbi:MAG: hypothetical protein K0M70_05300 [Arenimonas sp.]|uniref:hypothetical protein n=1 Tax=Arenimonas sp. TaxID=1872635 RepID=UPI0025BF15A0|nr:hypothetical protein [Arenimonas sp.]MBW8367259.1 hypothetical protein [Arenimonas sp.]